MLLGLLILSSRRPRALPGVMRSNPYVAFTVVYVLGFVWAFSGIGNFGILARQRVLMLPAFLVLLALSASAVRTLRSDDVLKTSAEAGRQRSPVGW